VKIQVEFNPATVSEYRLIGYENRLLNREDFNNDKVDAGEIGSGHTVTAIYEITPKGSAAQLVDIASLPAERSTAAGRTADEYGFLRIPLQAAGSDTSKLIETPISTSNEVGTAGGGDVAREARFASSVGGVRADPARWEIHLVIRLRRCDRARQCQQGAGRVRLSQRVREPGQAAKSAAAMQRQQQQ
jgi:hypothetical protein